MQKITDQKHVMTQTKKSYGQNNIVNHIVEQSADKRHSNNQTQIAQKSKSHSGFFEQPQLFQINRQQMKSFLKEENTNIKKYQIISKNKSQLQQFPEKLLLRQILIDYAIGIQHIQDCWEKLQQNNIAQILLDYIDDEYRVQVQKKLNNILNKMGMQNINKELYTYSVEDKLIQLFEKYKIDKKSFQDCLNLFKDKQMEKLYKKVPIIDKKRQKFRQQVQIIYCSYHFFTLTPQQNQNDNVDGLFLNKIQPIINKIQTIQIRQQVRMQILTKQLPNISFISNQQIKKQIQNCIKQFTTIVIIYFQNKEKGVIELKYFKKYIKFEEEFGKIMYDTLIPKQQLLIFKQKQISSIQFKNILTKQKYQSKITLECYKKELYIFEFRDKKNQQIQISTKLSNIRVSNIIKNYIISKYKGQIQQIFIRYQTQEKQIDLDDDNTLLSLSTTFFFKKKLIIYAIVQLSIYYRDQFIKIFANLSRELFILKKNIQQILGIPFQSQHIFKLQQNKKIGVPLSDKELVWTLSSDINFSLILQNTSIQQFYGFNTNFPLTFQYFSKFFIQNQSERKKFFVNFKFYSEEEFFWLLLNYLYSGMKKRFPIDLILQNFKEEISQITKIQIWTPKYDRKCQFNSQFVLTYLLKNAQPKLRIQLIKLVQQYLPIPLYIKQFENIVKMSQKQLLLQQLIWVIKKGFTICSVGLHKKTECQGIQQLGKSYLLNRLFHLNFLEADRKHRVLKNTPYIYHRIYDNIFPLNVIDIPKKCNQEIKDKIFKASNIILVHSWKSQTQTKKYIESLSQKYKICILCLQRDRTNEDCDYQSFHKLVLDDKVIKPLINIKNQENCKSYIQTLQKQIHQVIKKQSQNKKNQDKIFLLYENTQIKPLRDQIFALTDSLKERMFTCCPINKIQKQIQKIISKSKVRNEQDDKKIKQLQEKIQKQGLSPQVIQILQFLNKKDKYSEFIQLIIREQIRSLQKQKTQNLLKIYSFKDQYSLIIKGVNLNKQILKKQLHQKMKILQKVYPFQEKNILTLEQNNSEIWFKQLIKMIQNQIKPQIFSVELFWRQIFGVIKRNPKAKFKQHLLVQILTKLKRSEIMNNLPFQLIDGDLLQMPRLLISSIFQNCPEKCAFITILGPQSSGKSTLLNALFGCDFLTSQGRCTQGVYGTYYPFAQNSKIQQMLKNCSGIFAIDTEGLFSVSNQNDESNIYSQFNEKKRNFDAKLVVFCLAISDFIIINVKNNFDANTNKILKLCQQKMQKLNIPEQRQPSVAIVLNQSISGKIQQSQKQFQEVRKIFNFKIKKSLSFAYQIKNLNQKDVNLFNDHQILTKKVPKRQFLLETQKLLTQMISCIKERDNILPITQKIKQCQRIWSDILSFPDLSSIISKKQFQFFAKIKQWLNSIEKIRDEQIDKIKQKFIENVKNKNFSNYQNQIAKIICQQRQKCKQHQSQFQSQFCSVIDNFTPQIKRIIQNSRQNFKDRNGSWISQLQYILNKESYQQQLAMSKYQSDKQIDEKCNQIKKQIKNGKKYMDNQLQKIFNQIFNNFLSNLKNKLINLEQEQFSFKKIREDFNYLIKGNNNYGLPDEKNITVEGLNKFLKNQQNNNKISFKEFLIKRLIQPLIEQSDYCLQLTQSKIYTNVLRGGKTDAKRKYFDMFQYFSQVQTKQYIIVTDTNICNSLNIQTIKQIIDQLYEKNQNQKKLVQIVFNKINSQLQDMEAPILMINFENFFKCYKCKTYSSYFFNNIFNQEHTISLKIMKQNMSIEKNKIFKSLYFLKQQQFKQFMNKNCYLAYLQKLFQKLINWKYVKQSIQQIKQSKNFNKNLNQYISSKINNDLKRINLKIDQKQMTVDWISLIIGTSTSEQNKFYKYQNQSEFVFHIKQLSQTDLPKFQTFQQFQSVLKKFQYFKYKKIIQTAKNIDIDQQLVKYQYFNDVLKIGKLQKTFLKPIVQQDCLIYYQSDNIQLASQKIRSRKFKQFVFNQLCTSKQKKSSKIMVDNQKQNKNSFVQLIKKCYKIISLEFKQSKMIPKSLLINTIQKITQQLADFNADLNQVSLKLTKKFIGYTYYVSSCYVWFIIKKNKQNSSKKLIIKKEQQKKEDLLFFLNKISNDQSKNSQNDADNFFKYILDFQQNEFKQKKKLLIQLAKKRKNQNDFKDKFKRELIQDTVDKQILQNSNKNSKQKKQILDYIKHPAKFIKRKYQYLANEEINNYIAQSQSVEDYNHIEILNKAISSLATQFLQLNEEQAKFQQFFIQQSNEKLFIDKNSSYSDSKNVWFQYFISKLIKAQTQLIIEGKQIKQKTVIKIDQQISLKTNFINFLKELSKSKSIKISNMHYFLQIINKPERKIKIFNKFDQFYSQTKDDYVKQLKEVFSVVVCQEKCPCCNRVCGQEGSHDVHQVKYGHQIRALNGTYVQYNNKKIASISRCEQIAEIDLVQYNGNKLSWTQFKDYWKNKQPGSWSFQDLKSTKNKYQDKFCQFWKQIGKQICNQQKIQYVPSDYKYENQKKVLSYLHFIFALDESGSMYGQSWDQLIKALQAIISDLTNKTNISVSMLKFGIQTNIIYRNQLPNKIDISNLKMIGSKNTLFQPPFKQAFYIASQFIKKQDIIFIFMTDGESTYPIQGVKLLKEVIIKNPNKFIYRSIYLKKKHTINSQLLSKIASELDGKNVQVFDPKQLQRTYSNVMCQVIKSSKK